MTLLEMIETVRQGNLRNRAVKAARRRFPDHEGHWEEWVQVAMRRVFDTAERYTVGDIVGVYKSLWKKAKGLGLNHIKTEQRRALLEEEVSSRRSTRVHDPMRQIDYKIDLERGIRAVIDNPVMRTAMWHLYYEEWTWEEVIEALPKGGGINTDKGWESALIRASRRLKAEMRRKEYYRL